MKKIRSSVFLQGLLFCMAGSVMLLLSVWFLWGWIKDDAYISFRYSRHLAAGLGLVFNAGERVEGYTNFLWVIIMALVHTLGMDMVLASKILGALAALASLSVLLLMEKQSSRDELPPLFGLSVLFMGASTTLGVWSSSGLATAPFLLFSLAGIHLLLHDDEEKRKNLRSMAAAALLAVSALFRPEGHLVAAIAYAVVLNRWRTGRWNARTAVTWCIVPLVILMPYHLWRFAYFGDILPNTYYVKAGGGGAAFALGMKYLWAMLNFNFNGPMLLLAVAGLFNRRVSAESRAVSGVIIFSFMAYLVYIGVDEMKYFRLFLTALPFMYFLAVRGVELIGQKWSLLRKRFVAVPIVLVIALTVTGLNARENWEKRSMRSSIMASNRSHAALGMYVSKHSSEGEYVIFQDMGNMPWAAPKMRFIDPIGLVDRTVAHTFKKYGYHPFMKSFIRRSAEGRKRYAALAAEMRDYMLSRKPEWTGFVAYVPPDRQKEIRRILHEYPDDPSPLTYYITHYDKFTFELFADPRFQHEYHFVKMYRRSNKYYLVLYERNDHVRP